jgi:hypothetical protein
LASDAESHPLIALEALAAGKVLIGPRVVGLADMIDNGKNGVLYPRGDVGALADLLVRYAGDDAARTELERSVVAYRRRALRHSRSRRRALARLATARAAMIERISILLPCAAQKREYLEEALASVTNQTTSAWELLIGLDPAPPLWLRDLLVKHVDGERVRCVIAEKPSFAAVLNALMRSATTPFVAILLSDDRYTLDAVETLLRYRSRYPRADFFHSSRRYIDAGGAVSSAGSCRAVDRSRWRTSSAKDRRSSISCAGAATPVSRWAA